MLKKDKSYNLKKRIYYIMDFETYEDLESKIFLGSIMTLIFLNLFAVVFETVPSLYNSYSNYFLFLERFSVTVFTIEYLLRLWTCTLLPAYRNSLFGRIKFIFHPLMIIDLLAILPFYLPFFIYVDLGFLRAIRVLRVFRILKLVRYSKSYWILTRVINKRKQELFTVFFVELQLLILISILAYFVENPYQPDVFSSIPYAIWWGICTLMSLPYANGEPISMTGRFLGVLIAFLRIGILTLPAGIMASAFSNAVSEHKRFKKIKSKIRKGDL